MANFQPRKIIGKWRDGFALDLHTLSSVYIGDDEYGHPKFDTQRSEIGELLYKLKFGSDKTVVPEIVTALVHLLGHWKPEVDMLVPVPASAARAVPPVKLVAEGLCQRLGLPLVSCVKRNRDVPQLKNVHDLDERLKLLEGLHTIDASSVQQRRILLFDDVYRSGATMNAITTALYKDGGARDVFALTITRTRSNR
jgi:competence protein ComFC